MVFTNNLMNSFDLGWLKRSFLVVNGFKKWQISLDFEGGWGGFFVVYGV